MSQPTAQLRDMPAPQMTGPMPMPRVAPQRRWRPVLVFPAIALIAAGGLLSAFALRSVATTHEYIAVANSIPAGALIKAADLTTVRINNDPALKPIPVSQARTVINKYAATALVAGTLLTKEQVTTLQILGPGKQLVGITVSQDKAPAGDRLKAGMKVRLVVVADQQTTTSNNQPKAPVQPQTIDAIIVDINPHQREGSRVLNVSVAESDGPYVAQQAAAGKIVVVATG